MSYEQRDEEMGKCRDAHQQRDEDAVMLARQGRKKGRKYNHVQLYPMVNINSSHPLIIRVLSFETPSIYIYLPLKIKKIKIAN